MLQAVPPPPPFRTPTTIYPSDAQGGPHDALGPAFAANFLRWLKPGSAGRLEESLLIVVVRARHLRLPKTHQLFVEPTRIRLIVLGPNFEGREGQLPGYPSCG